ncbi:MAG: hypothetical protein IMZ50_15730, partial [Candidatus Atribacteria bacterium]|nr:hypothetical protein [Candidatus Atribacteria bacterium]
YQLADRLQEARYTDRSVSEGVTYFYKVKSEHNSAVGSYPMPGKSATLDFSARISGIEVGSAPGAIALGGNFAYVGTYEHGFSAVDKSTPWPPSLVGHADWSGCEYGTIPMSTGGIALSPDGKYAYVAAHARRLYVIGLNTATTPIDDRLKAVHEFTQGSDGSGTDGKDVAVAGGHVFATNYDFLYVYDAADSRDITYESRFDLRTYIDYAWRLSVQYLSDTVWRAYICGMYTGKRGLVIVDINVSANPATFTPRSTYSMDTAANQVQILGHYAYIASGQGIQVVDVSDPANPSLSCTFESSDSVSDLSIAGDFLYAMVMNKGLYRYRIVDPANPGGMILERVYDEVIDGHFVVAENYAYVANPFEGQGGLSIVYIGDEFFDFTDRAVLDFAGYGAYQNLSDFDVCDDVVFAAIRTGGLARARGVPPATFQPLGSYTPESLGAAAGVKVIGDLAFLADSNFGLRVIDVSNPVLEELEEIGSLKATFRERDSWMNYCQIGLEVVGDYVFLPDFDGGILVVDASDPNDLVKVAVIPMLANTFEVVAQEKTLYAAGHTSGLHAIDIADPENPHKLSTYFQGGSAMGLDVEDQIVYLAAFDRSVDIIDYANPAQPLLLGRYDWPDPLSWGWIVCAMDVDVVGSYAFVSRFEGGVMSLDISDPQHPYYQGGSESIGGFYQRDTST